MNTLQDDELLAVIQAKSRVLERQIRFRDWRETFAAGLGVLVIAPMALHATSIKRAGVAVVVAGLVFIVVTLHRARRGAQPCMDTPVREKLRGELAGIEAQIKLLDSVLSWYVAPLAVGAILMVIGDRPAWWITAACCALLALLAFGIAHLNRRAAREYLRPRHRQVAALLARLESNSTELTS